MDMKFNMENDFSALIEEATFSQIEKALEKVGLTAERYAKLACPVGTPESTGKKGYMGGTLRNSISHTHDKNTAYIGTNVEYAPYVEMGTKKMAARPYLKPAIADHIQEYKNTIEQELK